MNIVRHFAIQGRRLKTKLEREILAHRLQYHNPTCRIEYPVICKYGYGDLDAITFGEGVYIMAFVELIVFKDSKYGDVPGELIVGDHAVITTGVNIRAAGGRISIGDNSGIGQHSVLVATNHAVRKGELYLKSSWDTSRTGVTVGNNVWVGAGCYLLPGSEIGDNSVLGAGSVLTTRIPPGEIWAGAPARKIRDV